MDLRVFLYVQDLRSQHGGLNFTTCGVRGLRISYFHSLREHHNLNAHLLGVQSLFANRRKDHMIMSKGAKEPTLVDVHRDTRSLATGSRRTCSLSRYQRSGQREFQPNALAKHILLLARPLRATVFYSKRVRRIES